MKGEVKKKILSLPLAGNQALATYIQPCLLRGGVFDVDVAALFRRVNSEAENLALRLDKRSCDSSPTNNQGFFFTVGRT